MATTVAQMHFWFCLENMLALSGQFAIILGILPGAPPFSLQLNAGSMEVWVMVIMEGWIHINKGTSHVSLKGLMSFMAMDAQDNTNFNLCNNCI